MAIIIVPNSKENQACFNCASFQPYNAEDPVEALNGECRWCPKVGMLLNQDDYWNQYWPYIDRGDLFWCSKWKLTAQAPIVAAETPRGGVFPDDWNLFHLFPWNRRASLNQSCWNCNHYQYAFDPPVDPGMNVGECRKQAPPPVVSWEILPTNGVFQSTKFLYAGSSYFCSAWEMRRGTVPVDPGPELT